MSTPHIEAKDGEIAETVLLPGDPLRAKYIAENYLEDAVCYNKVRNAFGYTGTYKGHRISIQGTGMGIPSIMIYVNELIRFYNAKKLIRIGSCGGMTPDIKLRDVIIALSATTDSGIIKNTFGDGIYYAPTADWGLTLDLYNTAQENNIPVRVGNVISEDRFYDDEIDLKKLEEYKVIGVEMETAALFMLGAKYNVPVASILTVSDNITTCEKTTPEERERSFNDMINIALNAAIKDSKVENSNEN